MVPRMNWNMRVGLRSLQLDCWWPFCYVGGPLIPYSSLSSVRLCGQRGHQADSVSIFHAFENV